MSVQEVSQGCGVRLGIKVEGKTIDDAYIMVPIQNPISNMFKTL